MSDVIAEIAAERRRQIEVEGFTPEHDDKYRNSELALAAACYAMYGVRRQAYRTTFDMLWPSEWSWKWWKPKGRRCDLIRAAALIVAEIDRLDRAALTTQEKRNGE